MALKFGSNEIKSLVQDRNVNPPLFFHHLQQAVLITFVTFIFLQIILPVNVPV